MKCENIQKELTAYYYKELKNEELRLVEEHLKNCQSCREALAGIEKTLALVDKRTEAARPEQFWNSYLNNVYQKIDEDYFFMKFYRNIFIRPKLVPVLATSFLVFFLLIFSSLYLQNKNKKYEDLQLAQGIDLFEDYEIIRDLEVINNVEFLKGLKI